MRYDLKRDKPDPRDRIFRSELLETAIPPVTDLRSICPPIEDQGNLGSCTAHGGAGALEFLELREFRDHQTNQPQEFAGQGFQRMSRLFLYFNERFIEGTIYEDSGAQIRDCVKALQQFGICNENLWPYDISKMTNQPPPEAFQQAAKHKITQYQRVASAADMRACLATRFPVIIGFTVFQSFETQEVAQTGRVPMPSWSDNALGGHCVLVVGYDDNQQVFICRNSWGPNWGDKGYFYMPYDYLNNSSLAGDFWVVKR